LVPFLGGLAASARAIGTATSENVGFVLAMVLAILGNAALNAFVGATGVTQTGLVPLCLVALAGTLACGAVGWKGAMLATTIGAAFFALPHATARAMIVSKDGRDWLDDDHQRRSFSSMNYFFGPASVGMRSWPAGPALGSLLIVAAGLAGAAATGTPRART